MKSFLCTLFAVSLPLAASLNAESGLLSPVVSDRTEVGLPLELDAQTQKRSQALSHFAAGLYLQQQDPAKTDAYIQEFAQALALHPSVTQILEALTAPLFAREEYGRFIKHVQPIAKEHPDVVDLQVVLTDAMKKHGKTDAAISHLKEVLRRQRRPVPRLVQQLAAFYWEEKAYKEALRLFRRTLSRSESRREPRLWLFSALFHYSRGKQIEETEQEAPHKPSWYAEKARVHACRAAQLLHAEENCEFAGRHILQLARLLRQNEQWECLLSLPDIDVSMYGELVKVRLRFLFAEAYLQTDAPGKAVAELSHIGKLEKLPVQLRFELARYYARANRPKAAIEIYERQLGDIPNKDPVRIRLARLYLQTAAPRKAIEYAAACTGRPVWKHYLMSRAYYAQGKPDRALEELEKAEQEAEGGNGQSISELIDSVQFLMYSATLEEKTGHLNRALEKAREARRKAPEDPATANFLGYLLADHGRELNKARELIEQAVEAEPQRAAYVDSLAWVAYRQGQLEAALTAILKAMRLMHAGEEDGVVLHHAGEIFLANGLDVLAECYLCQALHGRPENPGEIKAKLKRLDNREKASP